VAAKLIASSPFQSLTRSRSSFNFLGERQLKVSPKIAINFVRANNKFYKVDIEFSALRHFYAAMQNYFAAPQDSAELIGKYVVYPTVQAVIYADSARKPISWMRVKRLHKLLNKKTFFRMTPSGLSTIRRLPCVSRRFTEKSNRETLRVQYFRLT
jgi:hypothetical protein